MWSFLGYDDRFFNYSFYKKKDKYVSGESGECYVARTKQTAALGYVSRTNQIAALGYASRTNQIAALGYVSRTN